MTEIRIPNIGDAENVEVIDLCAAPGDRVGPDDAILVIESDKASMEVPAGMAGVLDELLVDIGDAVVEGQPIARLSVAGDAEAAGEAEAAGDVGTRSAPATRLRDRSHRGATKESGAGVYAGPATRRLARELGVHLAEVPGSGAHGRIVKDDVKQFVKRRMTAAARSDEGSGRGIPGTPAVDFARFGLVESKPLTRVRAAGARNLRASWLNIPHVTQHDEVDVTELEAFRQSLKDAAADRNIKLSPLPFIIKACCHALRAFPTFNASLDANAENFLLKGYYNIGVAVDTDQGLIVPVLKEADRKGIWELAAELAELADRARNRRLSLQDTQGGTFSISSLGALGGSGFTPIVNAPEVAILGVSRLATRPVWDGAGFQPRKMLPLSLSYDHRAINGTEAGRFVGYLADQLKDIPRFDL